MNKAIKIVLIAFATIVLIIIIAVSIKSIAGGGDSVIATTPFEKQIQERVEKEINDKDYASAQTGFNSIMNYIDTETNITLANGQKNVSPEEAANAKAIVFGAYAPMVINRANQLFSGSVWTDSEVSSIGAEAKRLADMNAGNAELVTQLTNAQRIADDYKAAWGVVSSAKKCSTVDGIGSLISSAESYKKSPLTNCTSLVNALNNVGATAKSAVSSSILSSSKSIYNKCCNYGTYDKLSSAVEGCRSKANSYTNKYGSNDNISSAYGYLNSALSDGYDCYYYYYEDDYYYY